MYQEPYRDQEPGQAYYEDVPPGHTQPYPPPASLRLSEPAPAPSPRRGFQWLALACCLVSIASLVLAAWVWSAQSSARQAAARQATQMAQLRHALAKARASDARSLTGLAGQVSGMDSALNALAPYNRVCSQYLTGPNGGPTTFYFPCSDVKPGG
jgi:hypothetical protein